MKKTTMQPQNCTWIIKNLPHTEMLYPTWKQLRSNFWNNIHRNYILLKKIQQKMNTEILSHGNYYFRVIIWVFFYCCFLKVFTINGRSDSSYKRFTYTETIHLQSTTLISSTSKYTLDVHSALQCMAEKWGIVTSIMMFNWGHVWKLIRWGSSGGESTRLKQLGITNSLR